jgi:hypothetical protein
VGCNGSPLATISAIVVNGNSPYEYSFNGGSFGLSGNFTGLNAGTYTIIGKDASGCTISSMVMITSSVIVLINNMSITNSNCFTPASGTINISGTVSAAPATYSINYGIPISSGIFTSLTPGLYTVSVQDANGCHKDSVVAVGGPPPMYYSNVIIFYPPCSGGNGSIGLQGNGGVPAYTYSLNGSSFSAASSWAPLPAGSYTIQMKDANGCLHDTVIDLIQPPPISISSID